MAIPLPTTTIEAVNIILGGIGESPISVLVTDNQDVTTALRYLDESQREITSKGLWFNTEVMTITPNVGGEYELAVDVYSAKADDYTDKHFVQRGRRLYNLDDNTFTGNTDDLEVQVIIGLEFEDLPEQARAAIFYQTVRRFGDRIIGASTLHQITAQDELGARAALFTAHLEHAQYNSFESYTPANIISRTRI